ncbi:MAG: hypothetical protein LBS27_00445 [Bifidobacteriaceae bacterium]|nr:hypothetical protein [Bifidobacteriaceae bacterium]
MIDTASGVLMGTEDDIEALVQREFRTEGSVVDELLAERCRQADKDRA